MTFLWLLLHPNVLIKGLVWACFGLTRAVQNHAVVGSLGIRNGHVDLKHKTFSRAVNKINKFKKKTFAESKQVLNCCLSSV